MRKEKSFSERRKRILRLSGFFAHSDRARLPLMQTASHIISPVSTTGQNGSKKGGWVGARARGSGAFPIESISWLFSSVSLFFQTPLIKIMLKNLVLSFSNLPRSTDSFSLSTVILSHSCQTDARLHSRGSFLL